MGGGLSEGVRGAVRLGWGARNFRPFLVISTTRRRLSCCNCPHQGCIHCPRTVSGRFTWEKENGLPGWAAACHCLSGPSGRRQNLGSTQFCLPWAPLLRCSPHTPSEGGPHCAMPPVAGAGRGAGAQPASLEPGSRPRPPWGRRAGPGDQCLRGRVGG